MTGYYYLLTLTAPSELGAHCKKPRCKGAGDGVGCRHERCSCTPLGGVDLGEWNASHSARWNRFRTRLRQEYPGVQFMRGVEVQDGKRGGSARGALHDHALMWSPVPLDFADIKRWAMGAGFGHSVDMPLVDPNSKKAAYYVSKYVTKAADSRAAVPWAADVVDEATGEVTRTDIPGRYRTWSASREWGKTMTQVRAEAAVYAASRAAADRSAAGAGSTDPSGPPLGAKGDPPAD